MDKQIWILHERRSVGEAIAWSLHFAYNYRAVYVQNVDEISDTSIASTVILADSLNFFKLLEGELVTKCKVVVLVDDIENSMVINVLSAGAVTVIDISKGPEPMIEKIQQVFQSDIDDDNRVIQKLVRQQFYGDHPDNELTYNLTAKEKEILKLLREGAHLKLIAQKSGTSYETVRTHVKHIYKKIGVMSASEAIIKAMKMNL